MAIELARVFYESLADGLPVDEALAYARVAIILWVTAPAQRCALRGAWDTQTGLTDVETKTQYISVGDARTIQYQYRCDYLSRGSC